MTKQKKSPRTKAGAALAVSPLGRAYISSCDGDGRFILLSLLPSDRPDTNLCVELRIKAFGPLLHGATYPVVVDGVEILLDGFRLRNAVDFAPLSVEESAELATAAVERSSDELPESTLLPLSLLRRSRTGTPVSLRSIEAAPRLALGDLRELMKGFAYSVNWFFDMRTLRPVLEKHPKKGKPGAAWYETVAGEIEKPQLRDSLVAMASHQANWHAFKGETEAASAMLRAAWMTGKDFPKSPLVRVLLERSLSRSARCEGSLLQRLHDYETRGRLREALLPEGARPRGSDLAALDFAAATRACFDLQEDESRPGGDRTRKRDDAALTVGRIFSEYILAGGLNPLEELEAPVRRCLATLLEVKPARAKEMAASLLPSLLQLLREICSGCPYQCLDHPDQRCDEIFHGDGHPAFDG